MVACKESNKMVRVVTRDLDRTITATRNGWFATVEMFPTLLVDKGPAPYNDDYDDDDSVYLHSHSARHRTFLPEKGRARPESEGCQVPEGEEGGGADSVVGNQGVEGGQVDLLLVPHVLDGVPHRSIAQHCLLPGVDAVCSELSSVVNSAINQFSRLSAV